MPSELNINRGDELSGLFKRLDAKTVQNMQVGGLRKGAQLLRKEMRRTAPKSRTGLLHKNLVYTVKKEKGGVGAIAYIGPTYKAYYAAFLEMGTRSGYSLVKGSRKGREKRLKINGAVVDNAIHPGIKPKPFIRPAFDNKVEETATAIIDGVWSQIAKEFNK